MAKIPNGSFDNYGDLLGELESIIEEEGDFPTWSRLEELGRSDIIHGVRKQGGLTKVRKEMGFQAAAKPNGYWKDIDNVMAEAQAVMEEHNLDSLPNKKELQRLGHSGLVIGISKYHGGFNKFRELLGEGEIRKSPGYWQDVENAIVEARKVMEEHNFEILPTTGELKRLGHSSLVSAIERYYGGLCEFRERLGGGEDMRKPMGYWQETDNVVAEAQAVMEEHNLDRFPSQTKLVQLGYSSLVVAIQKYHGGLRKFRESIGEEVKTKPPGYWEDPDNVMAEARKIMKEQDLDTLPSGAELRRLGHSSLGAAIGKYHGGMRKFRELLGEEVKTKPVGYWEDIENVIEEAQAVMEEHNLDSLPNKEELQRLGYSNLVNGIRRYHGGFNKFRGILGEEKIRKSSGYWEDVENAIVEARKVMKEQDLDTLPSEAELRRLGHSSLVHSIQKYHGGLRKFRESIGEEVKTKPPGYWEDPDNVMAEARKIMEEQDLDTLPSTRELARLGHSSLKAAIGKYHGGMRKFRELLGEEVKTKPHKYWEDIENVIAEAQAVMEEHNLDRFPSQTKLVQWGYSSLSQAIQTYHGGFNKFRGILGEEKIRKSPGYWEDPDNVIAEARKIMKEQDLDTLPSQNKLVQWGYSGLSQAIQTYHGGFPAFRELLYERMTGISETEELEGLLQSYIGD